MIHAPRIDWRSCRTQAAWYALAYTVYSSMETIRVAGGGGTLRQALPVWVTVLAVCMAVNAFHGLLLAAGAQWTHAARRHRLWRGVLVLLVSTSMQPLLNASMLRTAAEVFHPSTLAALASSPFIIWRTLVGGTLFFGYCLLVQRSRQRQDQLARTELARVASELRLREARAQALEHCVDPVLLERTVAALRSAYARNSKEGGSLLDALVEFLRLAMPAVRAGATLDTDRAAVRAWRRLHDQLEGPAPSPDNARQGEP